MKKISVVFASCLVSASTVSAATIETLDQYFKDADNDMQLQTIGAIGSTLAIANAWLIVKGQSPLYCPPMKLSMTADQFRSMLFSRMEKEAGLKDKDASFMPQYVLGALVQTFPCPSK